MKTQVIYLPVTVPAGDFCFGVTSDDIFVCEHFDNEGGTARCMMGFHLPYNCHDERGNVLKPAECLDLSSTQSKYSKASYALIHIANIYLDISEMAEEAENSGVPYVEYLEMAYENIKEEARRALE